MAMASDTAKSHNYLNISNITERPITLSTKWEIQTKFAGTVKMYRTELDILFNTKIK